MSHRIFALFIVLFALAVRLYGLPAVRQEEDFARPHGEGIAILEAIQEGRFSDLPVLSLNSGINLPNPPGVAYFWAFIALFDRSPYTALVIVVLLNVLGVAMLYDLGRRLFGKTSAAVAALLMASSPWAIYNLHGAWLQAFLEFACVTTAWFVILAIQRHSGRRLFAGLALTALFMQTYLMAMALLMQVGAASGFALLARRKLARPIAAGLALCVLSAGIFAITLYTANPHFLRDLKNGVENTPAPIPSLPNPFGLHIDLAGFNHSLRLVSGRDYEIVWTNPRHADYLLRDQINDARANIVDVLVGLGAIIALLHIRRDLHNVILLTWFGLPAVLTTVILALAPNLYPEQWYLLITTPAGYLLAGMPFMLFERPWLLRHSAAAQTAQAALAVAGVVAMLIPATNLVAHSNTVFEEPIRRGHLETLAELYQLRLGALWRRECDQIDNPQITLWTASIFGSLRNVRNQGSRVVDQSDAWQVKPGGGNCVTRLPGQPAPPNAEAFPLTLSDGSVLVTYRARPINLQTDFKPLAVNLGWTLMDAQTTPAARAGDTVTVTHTWRIDQLPQEPYAAWYYAPFVNMVGPEGQRVMMIDKAPSILGANWRAGDYILSTIRFQVPPGTAPGRYSLELSLFDPNQQRNAVYFDPAQPSKHILAIERALDVR